MLRRNPVHVAGLGDSNVRELIQSEERFFRVFEGVSLFLVLESSFEMAWDFLAEALNAI